MLSHPEEKIKKNNKKEKCFFFGNYSSFVFLTFELSYCTQSFLITSGTSASELLFLFVCCC